MSFAFSFIYNSRNYNVLIARPELGMLIFSIYNSRNYNVLIANNNH